MKFFEEIPEYLIEWMLKQQMFWVASAPLSPDGHVNISPKGIEGTFHIVNSRRVWYEDLSGTGMRSVSTEHYYPLTIYFRCWNCLPYTGERSHYHSFSCIWRPSSDCTTLRKRFADFLLYPLRDQIDVDGQNFPMPLFMSDALWIEMNGILSLGFWHEIGSPEYDALLPSHTRQPGSRAAIGLNIHKVGTVSSIPWFSPVTGC